MSGVFGITLGQACTRDRQSKGEADGGMQPFVLEAHRRWIATRLTEKPDLTLRALAAELKAGVVKGSPFACEVSSLIRGSALKSLHASEQERPNIARRRQQWTQHQDKVDPKRMVFIDETWLKTNMTRTHGRCPCGQRPIAKVPYGHWKTLIFVAALCCDDIVAPWVLRQPVNAISFLACVSQFLMPTLQPGEAALTRVLARSRFRRQSRWNGQMRDVVIMDNLSGHKRQAIRAAIRDAGTIRLTLAFVSLANGMQKAPLNAPFLAFWAKLNCRRDV